MVLDAGDNVLVVQPLEGTLERELAETISIPTDDLAELDTVEYLATAKAGDIVRIGYFKEDSNISAGQIAVYEIVPIEK